MKWSDIRVIYGISGEGSGHAIRSREVIRHLIRRGSQVRVVTFGRAYDILQSEFAPLKIFGLRLDYRDNAIRYLPTIWKNVIRAPEAVSGFKKVADLFQKFSPHIVCTDFEPMSVITAMKVGVPVISIDNIHHVLFRADRAPWRYRHERLVAEAVIKIIVPWADRYVVTTLSGVTLNRPKVTNVPPILRPEILSLTPNTNDYILVYDSFGDERLPLILKQVRANFRVYGPENVRRDNNIDFRAIDEIGFINDLGGCQAVIGMGGFTLISESLALRKPYLALPVAGQFEQIDNGLEIQRLNYGMMLKKASVDGVESFIQGLHGYRLALNSYCHTGNSHAMNKIDELLEELLRSKLST